VFGTGCVGLTASTIIALLAGGVLSPTSTFAQSQSATSGSDLSVRYRPRTRGTPLRVYKRTLSPTAVRACDAWYEQEYRPSGTVIVPRMRCRWVDG